MTTKEWLDEIDVMRQRKRTDRRSAPLRTVISRDSGKLLGKSEEGFDVYAPQWKLECGHLVSPPQDIYGERFPNRVRCGECQSKQEKE